MKDHVRTLSLCAAAAALLWSAGCRKDESAAPPKETPADAPPDAHADEVKLAEGAVARYGIRVEAATKRVLVPTVVAPARVAFDGEAMAHVGTPVAGRVREIRVKRGDRVAKGDVLLVLDSPDIGVAQSEYLQKRTAVVIAEPAVDLAKAAYERGKALYETSKGITLTDLQKREADQLAAKNAVLAAQADVTAAENRLHLLGMKQEAVEQLAKTLEISPEYVVHAPIAGEVVEREATVGEHVGPEREALVVLADMAKLWVIVDVPEARLAEISVGSHARISAAAMPGRKFEGAVSYIAPELDPAKRTARVRVEVLRDGTALRPGMFAQASIAVGAAGAKGEPVLAVPEEAVQTIEGDPAVFVPAKGEANTFTKRVVRVGAPIDELVPVLEGLAEGESVVVAGSFLLKADLGKASAKEED